MKKYFLALLISFIVTPAGYLYARPAVTFTNKVKPHPGYPRYNQNQADQADGDLLNKPAPDFELPGLDGKTYSLKSLKGKIVVLNFWFIACKPCVNEMPVLNSIKNNYDPAKVIFIALSLDGKDAVSTFLQHHQFNYTILPGAGGVHKKYNLNAYPTSIVIDGRGIVSFVQVGGPNIGKNLTVAINAALKRV
jgi:peroxiredoxin